MKDRTTEKELVSTLLEQNFSDTEDRNTIITQYQQFVESYIKIDQSVAVLSDFQENSSYIYASSFGHFFGLDCGNSAIDSAFEECIFSKIHPEDLIERHMLELRYFQFQKSMPEKERTKYKTCSHIRARNMQGEYLYITHRTFYLKSLPNGSIWLALCLYSPSAEQYLRQGIDGKIINNETGEVVPSERYQQYDKTLLSRRELEILTQVALGKGSKQIADELNIALYTVHRHRQNIITKMQVCNTAEAVKTALMMGLISMPISK